MAGISINDIRKNLSLLNDFMETDCRSSEARYGVVLDASLITAIDPPPDVESALAAINTAHNEVSSDISLAQAAADQKIVQSKRAVEIETLNAQAEVEPLVALAAQLKALQTSGPGALQAYVRNVRLQLYAQAHQVILQGNNMAQVTTGMGNIPGFLIAAITTFVVCLIAEPVLKWLMRFFGVYAIVEEGTCHVYVLFGRVMGVLHEPGLYFLWLRWGPLAFIVNWFGKRYILDMRLDQRYLRSQPVNSEEGAPMGIGVWYEMSINDPVAYLFKNSDPQGSLAAM